jgi:hypothetical protein
MTILRSRLMVLAAVCTMIGCAKHKYVSPYQPEKIARADKVIVTTSSGSPVCCKFVLTNARIGDGCLTGYKGEKQIKIPLSYIESIRIVDSDNYWHIVLAALAVGVAAGAIGVEVALSVEESRAPSPPPSDGSCPYVYSFDGEQYVFDAEPYGGSISRGLKRTEWCGLEHLQESNGNYALRVANELRETQHIDEMGLVIVDHPPATGVAPNIRGRIHTIKEPRLPDRARDRRGNDILPFLSERDGVFWKTGPGEIDPDGGDDLRDDLILDFPKPEKADRVKLLVNCSTTRWGTQVAREFLAVYGTALPEWYAEIDSAGPALRKILDWYYREELYIMQVQVFTGEGWRSRGEIFGGGPFASKDKVYVLDLSDVRGDKLRIRLRPPAHFWKLDYLAVDYSEDLPVAVSEVAATRAVDNRGNDVTALLAKNDDACLVLPRIGDSAELLFRAPPRRAGLERTVILKAGGYYKIHLEPRGEPRADIIDQLNNQPGFSLRYALKQRRKWGDRLESADWEKRPAGTRATPNANGPVGARGGSAPGSSR